MYMHFQKKCKMDSLIFPGAQNQDPKTLGHVACLTWCKATWPWPLTPGKIDKSIFGIYRSTCIMADEVKLVTHSGGCHSACTSIYPKNGFTYFSWSPGSRSCGPVSCQTSETILGSSFWAPGKINESILQFFVKSLLHLYIVACQVHPASVKWSLVTRFYVNVSQLVLKGTRTVSCWCHGDRFYWRPRLPGAWQYIH